MTPSECPLCGTLAPADIGLCWSCAGREGDAALYLDTSGTSFDPQRAEARLLALFRDRSDAETLALAARGRQAIVRAPAAAIDRLRDVLNGQGLPTRVSRAPLGGASLPAPFAALVGLIALGGTGAGLLFHPLLVVTSPVFAAALWIAAQQRLGRPMVARPGSGGAVDAEWLPAAVRRRATTAMLQLPDGPTRELLGDVLRLARLLQNRAVDEAATEAAEEIMADLYELIDHASGAARDLGHLNESRAVLAGARQGEGSESDAGLLADTDVARRRLRGLLLDTVHAMLRARRRVSAPPTSESELTRLAERVESAFGPSAERGSLHEAIPPAS